MRIYMHNVWTEGGGQQRASDSIELRLQIVVIYHVGTGNKSQVLYKSSNCRQLLSHLCPSIVLDVKQLPSFLIFFNISQPLMKLSSK